MPVNDIAFVPASMTTSSVKWPGEPGYAPRLQLVVVVHDPPVVNNHVFVAARLLIAVRRNNAIKHQNARNVKLLTILCFNFIEKDFTITRF